MKILFCFFIIFLFCFSISSQVTQQWVARYNGSGDSTDTGRSIAVDDLGNIYIAGSTISVNATDTSYDFLTIKYNPSGEIQWMQKYDGTGHSYDEALDIAVDNSGNVFVAGISTGNGSYYDIVTIKYSTSGVQQWQQRYNGPANDIDQPASMLLDNSGNVYITGKSSWSFNNIDIVTIKYNTDGAQQWLKRYNSPFNNWDEPLSMTIDNISNIIVTGFSVGNGSSYDILSVKYSSTGIEEWVSRFNGTGNGYDIGYAVTSDESDNILVGGYTTNINSSGTDFVIIKYNSSGTQQWFQTYNGPGNYGDVIYSIITDDLNNIFVTGSSYGSNNNNDYATIKYNNAGIQQWVRRYNSSFNSNDVPWSLAADHEGNVFVTGWGGEDYATIKYSNSGTELWIKTYNGTGNGFDGASKVILDHTGNVYVTGQSKGIGSADQDCLTIKYSQTIGIQYINQEIPENSSLSQNYPNPFNPVTKIRFRIDKLSFVKLKVFDILGVELALPVNNQLKPGTYEIDFDGSNYASGVYYYQLMTGNYSEFKKMILVK